MLSPDFGVVPNIGKLRTHFHVVPMRYYFRDIPSYLMDEIIAGMIEGKTEPTPEEMEEWLASGFCGGRTRISPNPVRDSSGMGVQLQSVN